MKWLMLWVLNLLIGICETLRALAPRLGGALTMLRNRLVYKPRPDDVFVVSYPKSGTTWMQNILVQLASAGTAQFPHISQASPSFDDFVGDQELLPSPRIFKSHFTCEMIPEKAPKYIYITRHGLDVAVSYYHHYRDQLGYRASFEAFYRNFIPGRLAYGSWFDHVVGWRKNPKKLNVLFISFEEMKDDLPTSLRRIAGFCGWSVPEAAFPQILEHCSFAYMKEHQEKFDMASWRLLRMGIHPGNFIRKGEKKQWTELMTQEQLEQYRQQLLQHFGKTDDPYGL